MFARCVSVRLQRDTLARFTHILASGDRGNRPGRKD